MKNNLFKIDGETFALVFPLLISAAAGNAFADGRMICGTESAGLVFTYSDDSTEIAMNMAIDSCSKNPATRNDECRNRASCVGFGTIPTACETESAGMIFHSDHVIPEIAKDFAMDNCMKNGSTQNSECQARISCDNFGPNGPSYTCETESAGQIFRGSARSASVAGYLAQDLCMKSGSTLNSECQARVTCHAAYPPPQPVPPPPPPRMECTTTTSANMPYVGATPYESIQKCQAMENSRPQGMPWECDMNHTICRPY